MFYKPLNSTIRCADGFSMSVQASSTAYSTPRNNVGPYTTAEVGFPSQEEDLLIEYADNRMEPTETVYGYVPRQTIVNVIVKHGGIVEGELPEGFPFLKAVSHDSE